ncbi:MAG: insulinase family protein [Acidobacteria bacterium]|nr:insulinase family protein [Acidobacteriota bacterium]
MIDHTLPDGLRVFLDPVRDVRSVALGIYVKGGSADEAPERLGATHFLEHLLFKRTRRRTGQAIARMTDLLGGECDAYTTKECVVFHIRTTANRLDAALALLLDLTEAPAFTAEDVETERGVILEEMAEAADVPEDRLQDDLIRALWPKHPLGAPILGTKETVSSLTRTQLAERFREIFVPSRMAFVASGALDPDAFLALLGKERARRGAARARPARAPLAPRRMAPRAKRCEVNLVRPGLTQSHLLLATPGFGYAEALVPAASVVTTVLGGGVSSRLWREVREKNGLAYHVGAGLTLHRDGGLCVIEAATSPENLGKLVKRIAATVRKACSEGITAAELARAKGQITSEIALSLESTVSRREAAARGWLYRDRPYDPDEYLAQIAAVTRADAQEALERLFGRNATLGLGVAGPDPFGLDMTALAEELAAA